MTRVAETPMPQRRGSPGDKGMCWRKAQRVERSGAIAPDDLGPRRKSLHRTISWVKLNRAIIVGSKLANRDEILNKLWRHKNIIKT